MKNVILSLVAIGIAGLAAIAATTAMLNTPVKPAYIGAPKDPKADPNAPPKPSTTPPATPSTVPEPSTPPPKDPSAAGGARPATPPTASGELEADKDPYEGIAPEDLPPDLQYDADSSVSFPTNT
jgi:hypothetical protein